VDTAVNQLSEKLDKNKPGLKTYLSLEKMLASGEIDAELCEDKKLTEHPATDVLSGVYFCLCCINK